MEHGRRGRSAILLLLGVSLGLLGGGIAGAAEPAAPTRSLTKMNYGKLPDGTPVELYILRNGDLTVSVMTYGAIVTKIVVPDRSGKPDDVTLGFDTLEGYLGPHPYFGATVGRVANRIAGARFTLGNREYRLAANNGPHSLHGGRKGFDKVVWKAEPVESDEGPSVRMSYRSPDGEEGYPGNLDVSVTFTATSDRALRIDYVATTDQSTPVNLSNHTSFNLGGQTTKNILEHELMIEADRYTPVDATLIPTGELAPVAGTPMDFTRPTPIGQRIEEVGGEPTGYDHNYVLRSGGKTLALAARAFDPATGRILEMLTTEPGVQFYTGNFLDGTITGKGGIVYRKHHGFCLEAQHFPDSVHHPQFPSVILEPGSTYRQTTIYRFLTR
jgi:aldose 1-epimerase